MIAPNAEQIEAAAENLLRGTTKEPVSVYPILSDFIYDSQLKELESAMGAEILEKLGSSFPLTENFKLGYMLGIQTARMVLMTSMSLITAKIKPEDVL